MALKDLIVDGDAVTEEAIEEIISPYVKYEVNPNAIVFTPQGTMLGNRAKVIVYFAAILGWKYVVNEPPVLGTKPADLEKVLGVRGSTIRPVLKELKDNQILTVVDGHYSLRASNLVAAGRIVSGEERLASSQTKSKSTKAGNANVVADGTAKNGGKSKKKTAVPIKASLDALLDEDFFSEFRTLTQIVGRLHELAVIAKVTSLSGPVADLVRDKKLQRRKVDENGRQVWAYQASQD